MTISLNGDVASRLQNGVQVGSAIELPFFVPRIWALSGNAALVQVGGAQYFGGWAVSAEDWQRAVIDEWLMKAEPANFIRSVLVNSEGKNIDAYTIRSVIVAPICTRTTWFTDEGRFIEFVPGARQHVQAIVMLANKNQDGTILPYGPAMLTAKGFQAKHLLDSFVTWDRATKAVRSRVAPGVPAWCFYLSVGTFGPDRKQVMVGKRAQKPITPLSCYVPKEITEPVIERLFVGQEVAENMAYLLEQAGDWLHAYDAKTMVANAISGNGHGAPPPPPPDDPFDLAEPPAEDFPF